MKPMHRDREEYPDELTKMKIDLACALNDKRKVYLPCSFFFIVSHCINVFLLFISSIYLFIELGMMHLIRHKAMWSNGCKFCIKKLDDKRKTFDCGIIAVFHVTSVFL